MRPRNPSHRRPRLQRLFHNQPPLHRTATTARTNSSPYPIQLKLRFGHTIILKPAPPLVHPANTTRLPIIHQQARIINKDFLFAYPARVALFQCARATFLASSVASNETPPGSRVLIALPLEMPFNGYSSDRPSGLGMRADDLGADAQRDQSRMSLLNM